MVADELGSAVGNQTIVLGGQTELLRWAANCSYRSGQMSLGRRQIADDGLPSLNYA
jgi:hypothetical protein